MSKTQLGLMGELIVKKHLKEAGLRIARSKPTYGDMLVNGTAVEVKTARAKRGRGTYNACLSKKDQYGGTSCKNTSLVIVICVLDNGLVDKVYVIPTVLLNGQKSICIGRRTSCYDQWKTTNYVESIKQWLM